MQPPARVTVPTCIGCGAMSQFGTCERGCSEQKLELVHAVNHDTIQALSAEIRVNTEAFRSIAEELVSRRPGADEYETAYRAVQHAARAALRTSPDRAPRPVGWEEPAERTTTWWCAECGGIDAPQPCLGICIWRPVDWVNANQYEQQRTRALAERTIEQSLRLLLRRIAFVTPRPGQWEGNWRTLEIQARQTLARTSANQPRARPDHSNTSRDERTTRKPADRQAQQPK